METIWYCCMHTPVTLSNTDFFYINLVILVYFYLLVMKMFLRPPFSFFRKLRL